MGYRHYMYLISKEVCKEVKNMKYEELVSKYGEDEYFSLHDLEKKEIYNFGKLYWDDTSERIYRTGTPMFNEDVMKKVDDYVPYLVGKEGLEVAIDIYRKKTEDFYRGLEIDGDVKIGFMGIELPIDITKQEKVDKFLQEQIRGWSAGNIYNLDQNNEDIVNSYKYEYQIFELVRLYKSIDFNKFNILFMGW